MTMTKYYSSRTQHLQRTLTILGYTKAYEALELVIKEMCVEKGFKRHNGAHYFYHLVDVAQLLLNFGIRDEITITAALLHDYLEDVNGASKSLLVYRFGEEVAEVVDLVTKNPEKNYHEDEKAMNEYLKEIFENPRACLVKSADRINNFQTMKDSSTNHRKRQLDNTIKYYIPFFKECRNRYVNNEAFYFQAKTMIEPIAIEVGRYIDDLATLERQLEEKTKEIEMLKSNQLKQPQLPKGQKSITKKELSKMK
jgi:GTP pyrophosphokinase